VVITETFAQPSGIRYEENYHWVRADGDILVMGRDDFARQMAGEFVYIQLPFEGKKLKKGKKLKIEGISGRGGILLHVN